MRLSRINFRMKLFGITLFFMMSQTQTLKGIISKLQNGKHIPQWDLDSSKHTPEQIKEHLRNIQQKHGLSNIYMVSDKEPSYRAWCFSQVDLQTYIKILADSLDIIDYNFFYWTVYLGYSTLRISPKIGRPNQKVVAVIESFYEPIPFNLMKKSTYDTGLEKLGTYVKVGGAD